MLWQLLVQTGLRNILTARTLQSGRILMLSGGCDVRLIISCFLCCTNHCNSRFARLQAVVPFRRTPLREILGNG